MDAPTETEIACVVSQARTVAPRYGFDVEDVTQEVWCWYYGEGNADVQKYIILEDWKRLTKAAYNAAVRYCEKERKNTLGYDWRDDFNYTRPHLSRLLPLALDTSTIPGLSGGGLHDGPSSRQDPAYGGGMLAELADCRIAFDRLSEPDQLYIRKVLAADCDWTTLAEANNVLASSMYNRYMRVLDKMVKHLGRRDDDA